LGSISLAFIEAPPGGAGTAAGFRPAPTGLVGTEDEPALSGALWLGLAALRSPAFTALNSAVALS